MGVIGAGAWGKNHVRTAATLPEAELVAVCDADPKTRERIGRQYPAVHVTADVADLLSRVDAVVIASPATTLARVYYLYGLRVNLGQVRADENALWSFGPHDVSVALYLLGEAPVRVAAHG